jgi:hypothetical protein
MSYRVGQIVTGPGLGGTIVKHKIIKKTATKYRYRVLEAPAGSGYRVGETFYAPRARKRTRTRRSR